LLYRSLHNRQFQSALTILLLLFQADQRIRTHKLRFEIRQRFDTVILRLLFVRNDFLNERQEQSKLRNLYRHRLNIDTVNHVLQNFQFGAIAFFFRRIKTTHHFVHDTAGKRSATASGIENFALQ
jgi:hypothetical protein